MALLTRGCKAEKSEGNGCWDLEECEEVTRIAYHEIHSPESAPFSGLLFFNDILLAEGGSFPGEWKFFDSILEIQ